MLFTSFTFAVLLAVTVSLYWLVPWQRARLALLLMASLTFYSWHHWPSVFLLLGTIAVNYTAARMQEGRRSRALLAVIIGLNLLTLGWFKYAAFASDNLQLLVSTVGLPWRIPRPSTFLPLGISFFTFQIVAYQVDVFRAEIAAERSLLRFAVFKCFFPQLIAGPIVRAADFLPQLRERRRFDAQAFHQGMFLVIAGLALKIGVADVLAQFAREAFAAPASLTTIGAWTGLYAFAFQLFADFWGYSTMAVGMGLLFGLSLPLNFDTPYAALSLQEFWRRWHMTLSRWFRDYVYIPLGGNRSRPMVNLVITMALAGLWHGAGWTFVLWGLANGLWLVAERYAPTLFGKGAVATWTKRALVFHGVCLCWVLFRAPTLDVARAYFARLLLPPYTSSLIPAMLATWLVGFAILHPMLARLFKERRFPELSLGWQVALSAGLVLIVVAYAGAQLDFIYFTF